MKITKTFIGVFLLTFLVGIFGYFGIRKINKQVERREVVQTAQSNFTAPKIEIQNKPNVYNIENFWDDLDDIYNRNLLEIGEVSNGEDIKAKSGETWFGLFSENGKDVLRPTKIKIKVTKEENRTWKDISVTDRKSPIFLLKNKRNLKTGEVKTLYREYTPEEINGFNESATIKDGFNKKFYLEGVEYTLRVEKAVSAEQEPLLVLLLETENTSQMVHFIYYMEEGDYVGNLYWVGDLDRDGKLDLYMDFYGYEKGGYSTGLFLSSEAEKGNLVKKIGYFMLGGC